MGKAEFGMAAGIAVVSCTVAVTVVRRRLNHRRKWNRVVEILRGFEEACGTPVTRLRTVVDAMAVEMFAGLATEGGSRLKMLLTFVDRPPNGSEKGTYYALDLGGTNFRVLRVQLGGRRSGILRCDIERHPISEPLLLGTSKDLFESIASSLKNFVEKEEEGSAPCAQRELGFSFSFPVKQMSVSSGTLIKWTKGFSVEDMIGKDVAKCLQEAITESGLDMHVAVLVNDSVGTLALGRYYDDDTVVAVVIDTETHACYVERAGAIVKFHGLPKTTKQMVINMEWANFWSGHLPRTSYDIELAAQSPYPHEQGFDKMISGMYLGDIVRRVLLRISQETDIFGAVSSKLSTPFILTMPLMVTMHEDETPDLRDVARVLNEVLERNYAPLKVRKLVVNICDIVTHRAGRLVAAGIVGILKKIGRDGSGENSSRRKGERIMRTVVAVEGAVYSKYRMFREYMEEGVAEILGEDVAPYVVLKEVEDGSGVGAALLAASQYSRI